MRAPNLRERDILPHDRLDATRWGFRRWRSHSLYNRWHWWRIDASARLKRQFRNGIAGTIAFVALLVVDVVLVIGILELGRGPELGPASAGGSGDVLGDPLGGTLKVSASLRPFVWPAHAAPHDGRDRPATDMDNAGPANRSAGTLTADAPSESSGSTTGISAGSSTGSTGSGDSAGSSSGGSTSGGTGGDSDGGTATGGGGGGGGGGGDTSGTDTGGGSGGGGGGGG